MWTALLAMGFLVGAAGLCRRGEGGWRLRPRGRAPLRPEPGPDHAPCSARSPCSCRNSRGSAAPPPAPRRACCWSSSSWTWSTGSSPTPNGSRRLSPVYYYNLSKPLVPGYGANAAAHARPRLDHGRADGGRASGSSPDATSAALCCCHAGCGCGRARRERALPYLFGTGHSARSMRAAWRWSRCPPPGGPWPSPGCGSWMVVIVQQTAAQLRSLLEGSAMLKGFVNVGVNDSATDAAILSALFIFLPLLLMAFAVTQANRWSADEEDGRLELVLSTPQSRLSVLLGRFAALATATVIIAVVTLLADGLHSGPRRGRARPGLPGRGDARDDPARPAGRRDRIPGGGLAADGGRDRADELRIGDLVLHQLHRPGAELAGSDPAPVRLLLLRHASAPRPAGRRHSGGRGRSPRWRWALARCGSPARTSASKPRVWARHAELNSSL